MKRFLIVLFVILSFLISSAPVFAHVLQKDGTIGAVIHINPDDDPIIGQEANFFFDLKDTSSKFKPEECNCAGKILKDGKEVYSTQLFALDPTTPGFTYAFPEKGIYIIQIAGAPIATKTFQSFTLSWEWRVERTSGNKPSPQKTSEIVHYLALGLIAFVFLLVYFGTKNKKVGVK
jgi:hypothetical protein